MNTVRDVAQLAGVSTATVSRVTNGASNVSPETRDKVMNAIAELGYRPNQAAATLSRRRSPQAVASARSARTGLSASAGLRRYAESNMVRTLLDENERLRQQIALLQQDAQQAGRPPSAAASRVHVH